MSGLLWPQGKLQNIKHIDLHIYICMCLCVCVYFEINANNALGPNRTQQDIHIYNICSHVPCVKLWTLATGARATISADQWTNAFVKHENCIKLYTQAHTHTHIHTRTCACIQSSSPDISYAELH